MIGRPRTTSIILALFLTASVASSAWAAPAAAAGGRPSEPQRKSKVADEKNPQYQYEKGVIALRYGLADEAVRYGLLAVSLDSQHFNGWNLLGSAYYGKREFALALDAYAKAVAINPGSADAQKGLGLSYLELKEPEKAAAALKKSFEINRGYESAYLLAKLAYEAGRFEESLDYVLKSIQDNGQNAAAYNLKGVVLNQLARYAEAAGSFQAGLVLAPGDVNIRINLGIALLNSGEPSKARALFEAVLPEIEQDVLRKKVEEYIKAIKDAGK